MGEIEVLRPLKAIRLNCLRCCGGPAERLCYQLVKDCAIRGCPLWAYRFGVRPETAAKKGLDVDPDSECKKRVGDHIRGRRDALGGGYE